MKVNRRSFFSVAAAAPVAAKQAVASVLEYEKANGLANQVGLTGGVSYAVPDSVPGDWIKGELEDALSRKKRLSTSEPDVAYHRDLAAYIQIDNRRATSPAVRALLIAEERGRRQKARELSYLDERIADLKEKLGPLGVLFD